MFFHIEFMKYFYRDENGGIPGIHITEILGASQSYVNQALAAGALAYVDEPKNGTVSEVNRIIFFAY